MEKITSITRHLYFNNFVLYALTFTLLGFIITGLGPLIPYLADKSGRVETDYSFLFLCRAAGYVSGSLTVKLVQKHFSYHHALSWGIFLCGFFAMACDRIKSLNISGFFLVFCSVGCAYIDIFANMAAIQCFKKGRNLAQWLQALHGCFGLGGLLGPFIVYILQEKSFLFMGISMVMLFPFVLNKTSPQLINITGLLQRPQKQRQQTIISHSIVLAICGMLFLIIGQQIAFGGWISSYAVLMDFSTKEHATLYSSLYWLSITVFRFALAMLPGKPSIIIYVLTILGVVNTFLSLYLIYAVSPESGLLVASLGYGLANSVIFPLLLSLPAQFGLAITASQNSSFMLAVALAEGTVSMGTGYLMKLIHYDFLFYSIGLLNFVAIIIHYHTLNKLAEQQRFSQRASRLSYENQMQHL